MTSLITNFERSFVRWSIAADPDDHRLPGHMPWGNSVRIEIDARCSITSLQDGTTTEFYLIAPCRKEWMYRDTELIMDPGAEYRVIFSQDHQLDVAMNLMAVGDRPLPRSTSGFLSLAFDIDTVAATRLSSDADVVAAAESNNPIIARTSIVNRERQLSALLEYPVRTMNFHPDRQRFQVDTGPLIFADLASDVVPLIDRCRLAHTVYNTFDYAEFVCRPRSNADSIGPDTQGLIAYTQIEKLAVASELFALSRSS